MTRADLAKIAKQLKTAWETLDGFVEKMKQEKKDVIAVKGRAGVERERGALDILRGFVRSVRDNFPEF